MNFYVTTPTKTYEFDSGFEVYIFDIGTMHEFEGDELIKYVSFVSELYLKDNNHTPLGHLCDYVAEHWEEVQKLDRRDILNNFYDSII